MQCRASSGCFGINMESFSTVLLEVQSMIPIGGACCHVGAVLKKKRSCSAPSVTGRGQIFLAGLRR